MPPRRSFGGGLNKDLIVETIGDLIVVLIAAMEGDMNGRWQEDTGGRGTASLPAVRMRKLMFPPTLATDT
jgi:hypothetical protein